ncbi:MAG TPA: hypothetical protein VKT54_01515 [Steroidobacteraceae bacterium]|nr:hypothetical protein [Steroidobacteraceae bacterium]
MSRHFLLLTVGAAILSLGAVRASPAQPADTISHAGLPSIAHEASAGTSPEIPAVAVTPAAAPAGQQLAGHSLSEFILHHATVRYVSTGSTRNLARWRGGRQSICPVTVGLSPQDDALVTARLRAVAAYVGAPVQSDLRCKENVQIIFTSNPQEKMDEVLEWATRAFGTRYSGGMRDLIAYRSGHPIEGFYITTRGGSIVLNTDVALVGLDVLPIWPRVEQKYLGSQAVGTRLGGSSGSGIGIGVVVLVVDTTKIAGYALGTIADYLTMLTLTVVQSPGHCDALPSILDSMTSSCGTAEKPAAMTAGDLAFLKALYYLNTGLGPSLSRDVIRDNMASQFGLH